MQASTQQTIHVNPMKEERQTTNASCISIFMLILLFWMCTIIKVITDGTIPEQKLNSTRRFDYFVINSQQDTLYPRFTWIFAICIIISGILAMIYTLLLSQHRGKFIVYIGMFLLYSQTLGLLLFVIALVALLSLVTSYSGISSILLIVLSAPILLIGGHFFISCRSAHRVGTEAIFEIVRDACRAIRGCPSVTIFTCVMSFIIILILTFLLYFTKRIIMTDCSDGVFYFYMFINLYCAVFLIFFFGNFTHMVISGHIIDWVWANDPNSNTLTIRHSLERTLRFHLGTIVFFSIPLLPHIYSIYQTCRRRDSDNDIVKRYDIFTRICGQFRVFMSIMDFGLIQTSIYGHECRTAIMAAHDLVSQNNHELFLAVSEVSDKIVLFGLALLTIPFSTEHIHYSIYSFIIPFCVVLTTAVRTFLVDKMIVNYTSGALKEKNNSAHSYMVL